MEWLSGFWVIGLLLLVCIGMHFFMHGGHGKSDDNDDKQH